MCYKNLGRPYIENDGTWQIVFLDTEVKGATITRGNVTLPAEICVISWPTIQESNVNNVLHFGQAIEMEEKIARSFEE